MKKLFIFIAFICIIFASCTPQARSRHFGGDLTINLPAGQELMEATWKDNNLYYLTRPMSDDYVPVTKTLHESSRFGVLEGKVYFIETK